MITDGVIFDGFLLANCTKQIDKVRLGCYLDVTAYPSRIDFIFYKIKLKILKIIECESLTRV